MSNQMPKDLFSGHAKDYSDFRPSYPEDLINYICHLVKYRGVVWDCACGNGQLAIPLAEHFHLVMASDISEKQILQAPGHRGVLYTVQQAENTDFPDEYFDMVVVGQAIHWFNHEAFYHEVNRVLAPQGVIVAIGYGLMSINPPLNEVLQNFYKNIVGPYWPLERAHLDAGYETIPWPFESIQTPAFDMTMRWTFDKMMNYLNTWSSVKLYENENGANPVALVAEDFKKAWGREGEKVVRFPLFVKAGKKLV
jgi:ubiquinone/menaquinone biosynthesis C-methylase UbiE